KREIKFPVSQINHKVELIKAYAGMDSSIFDYLSQIKIDGVIIEALGQGNLPPETLPRIQRLIDQNIPIVLVSRCFNGIVEDVYGYEGGGAYLKNMGVIFSNGLNGQKARIKLLLALETTKKHEDLIN